MEQSLSLEVRAATRGHFVARRDPTPWCRADALGEAALRGEGRIQARRGSARVAESPAGQGGDSARSYSSLNCNSRLPAGGRVRAGSRPRANYLELLFGSECGVG